MTMPDASPPPDATPEPSPVVIKKYANRRLYNTETSSYITLDSLAGLVRQGRDFVVYDAKTGEDITRSVLTQIIVEEESKGRAMLPTAFLRHLIGFYGDSLQQFVPPYLEQAMSSFAKQQEEMRTAMQATMGNLFPGMQDFSRTNMAMMERAMSLFSPFYRPEPQTAETHGAAPSAETASHPAEMDAMRLEIERLRLELAAAKALPAHEPEHQPETERAHEHTPEE